MTFEKMKKFRLYIWVENVLKMLYIVGLCTILLLVLNFQLCSHFWRQCSVAMIFPVCPGRFWTAQVLAIRADKSGSAIRKTDKKSYSASGK